MKEYNPLWVRSRAALNRTRGITGGRNQLRSLSTEGKVVALVNRIWVELAWGTEK